jgi:hypothetical protein
MGGGVDENEVRQRLERALRRLRDADLYLLENDLSERCIAARLAMYLQPEFGDYAVDVEYNRAGDTPKRLNLPDECANYRDRNGDALAVPDVIVHRRGPAGPNLLVLEMKKTTNPAQFGCDRARVLAFRARLGYQFGALIACETRQRHGYGVAIEEWIAG